MKMPVGKLSHESRRPCLPGLQVLLGILLGVCSFCILGMGQGWAQTEGAAATPQEALPAKAPPPAPLPDEPAELLQLLNENQITRAIGALREQFIQPGATAERELLRAQMAGLLQRLEPGVRLLQEDQAPQPADNVAFLGEIIDGRIGYIRLGEITPGDLAQMDSLLGEFQEKGLRALVLDLRGVRGGADFDTAAEVVRRFAPRGRVLFRLEKPGAKQERIFTANQDPFFKGSVVVLVGPRTAGAAEVVAASLRQAAGAMVLGQSTRGQPVEFLRAPLGGGVALELAVAEAILPDNERLFPQGVTPDLVLPATVEREDELLRLAGEGGVSGLIFEQERPRMNEAALIANANPEIEAAGEPARSSQRGPRDTALQRAVDILTAIALFSR